ncbi:MAG TPA: ATP-dependent DNA helicase DinG [Pseudomonadales bacterium]
MASVGRRRPARLTGIRGKLTGMGDAVLSDALKSEIQQAYRAWLEARGFRARRGQREMIAQVARTLTGEAPRLLVVEAGTGTGKTAAYCLPAIPIARTLGKAVVISTATVALQEQVVLRDLPDLKTHSGLTFDFALAKGRGRYVCLKRLDDRLRYAGQPEIPLFESEPVSDVTVYQSMLHAFAERRWNGELDTWSQGIEESAWRAVTTDHRGCTGSRCSYFRQCPFFKARAELEDVDVIVANHDLVLADLALGGGAVLPSPEDTVYVLDEAHHLPDKTQQHFAASARLGATAAWLDTLNTVLGSLAQRFARPDDLMARVTRVAERTAAADETFKALQAAVATLPFAPRDEALEIHRFPLGEVPEAIVDLAAGALVPLDDLAEDLGRVHGMLQEVLAGERSWPSAHEAEDWLPVIGQHQGRALSVAALLGDYARSADAAIHARWVNRSEHDVELVSAPIEPGRLLAEHLWQRAFAAVCTSATLTALGSFQRFFDRAGLDDGVTALAIPSPFDYPRIATFTVPAMRTDPRDFEGHSAEVAEQLPVLLAEEVSALVLFTSWRQLTEVRRRLPEAWAGRLLCQGDAAKQALLDAHRQAVDRGEQSILVGLASFAEGLDLPDDYCRHVVIVKLPFAVPEDPLDQAMAEWAERQGRNPFFEIAVPDAALRLVQACGRLIRHEGDHGRITLLDRRILTARYGRALLDSLPPYRMELGKRLGRN